MSLLTNSFLDQCSCNSMALNTIFPVEKRDIHTMYPFEGSFEDLLKAKIKKGKKVYRVLEGLRKSKSCEPMPILKKKKSLPSIKLSEHIHSKKKSNQYVIGKTIKLSNIINFHRKLIYFNQRRIIKENNKQITKFKSSLKNAIMNDDNNYSAMDTMKICSNDTKLDNSSNKKCISYSVLKSNKWDNTLQDFLQNKFEKTKQLFFMINKQKKIMNNTTVMIHDDIKGNQNKRSYQSHQNNIFKRHMKDVTPVNNKDLNRIDNRDKLDKWKM